ncbi:hypothetical protein FBALC1_00712 [Flavobacteriales bacterium ALC-1]|nr:hypothetical protein FBALC1_00712 [Flavobacteriales bacterium ALC-1]
MATNILALKDSRLIFISGYNGLNIAIIKPIKH